VSAIYAVGVAHPRTLAGATILQLIPSLAADARGRDAVNTAFRLLQVGGRAIIGAAEGPLVKNLTEAGGEWLPMSPTGGPLRMRRNARTLEKYATAQRVDIIHAQGESACWTALAATANIPVWVVTSLPDVPPTSRMRGMLQSSLARGDRVVASSDHAAAPFIARYEIPPDRLAVIHHSVDTTVFDINAVTQERMAALRRNWGVRPEDRVLLVPARPAPWNGQTVLLDAIRLLVNRGLRGTSVVLAGDATGLRGHVRALIQKAQKLGIDDVIRITGHCRDMPAAYATAEMVVLPTLIAPATGRIVAEAQAMARPVIASDLGPVPESMIGHARTPDEQRTGWLVPPGDAAALEQTIAAALSMDDEDYSAIAGRARQFAEARFSPHQVAAAICEVYASVLARDE
jgi:glycosyltransferase involved in cell wall biosynthesis